MLLLYISQYLFFFFFFNDPATTEIYPLSLHDALPIFEPNMPYILPSRLPPAIVATPTAPEDERLPDAEPPLEPAAAVAVASPCWPRFPCAGWLAKEAGPWCCQQRATTPASFKSRSLWFLQIWPSPAASVSRCRDSEEECTVGGAWPATA